MPNPFVSDDQTESGPKDNLSTWDEVRRLADELELEIHLASMNVRDRWRAMEPRLAEFEHRMKDAGQRASRVIADELEAMWKALREIRDDVVKKN